MYLFALELWVYCSHYRRVHNSISIILTMSNSNVRYTITLTRLGRDGGSRGKAFNDCKKNGNKVKQRKLRSCDHRSRHMKLPKKLNSQLFNIFKSKGKFFTMALVDYSDWDDSDSESPPVQEPTSKKATTAPATDPKRIVDRGNPRKIRVNLDAKPIDETAADGTENDGPARKRSRIGASGGSGFNAMLPAPKKVKPFSNNDTKSGGKDTMRGAFNLKTSTAPGFDRQEIGQGKMEEEQTDFAPAKSEDVKIKGNAMMFKPLSIARNTTKKKSKTVSAVPPVTNPKSPDAAPPAPKPKQKASLFGLSATKDPVPSAEQPTKSTTYEPLVYNTEPAPGPNLDTQPDTPSSLPQQSTGQAGSPSLQSIASDLNLSKSEMRQLLGRHGQQAPGSKILTFDTEKEYKANSDYLAEASDAELAAMKHNPVRAIAPGKHSLQQLVNAASNQRDALEESFASGKRNKKEAGSKYGW